MRNIWIAAAGLLAAAAIIPAGTALAQMPSAVETYDAVEIGEGEYILGKEDAPVTIVEYASLTCGHCAHFHRETLPDLKKEYIDTGKVRLVYRDFPLDGLALRASMLARCSGPDRYFAMLNIMFTSQKTWAGSKKPLEELSKIGRLAGISNAAFGECMKNETIQNAVLSQRLEADKKYHVNSTPTLIINNKRYRSMEFPELKAVLDALLPKS